MENFERILQLLMRNTRQELVVVVQKQTSLQFAGVLTEALHFHTIKMQLIQLLLPTDLVQ